MTTLDHPLRLAVGSHEAGTGRGCAMNVISWESGDTTITDLPECADPFLALVVQQVNDTFCVHLDDAVLLCPACSVAVLALAHRTTGTALTGWTSEARRRVYVQLALDEAESVAHAGEDPRATECRRIVRAWLDGTATKQQVQAVAQAGAGCPPGAWCLPESAGLIAARAAGWATVGGNGGVWAACRATREAAASRSDLLARAHNLIDRFASLTGVTATPTPTDVTAAAVTAMTKATP